jgi:hypothetical protein
MVMPNGPHNVDLTIGAGNQYQFTGGSQGNGNCQNGVGQGASPVQVTLAAPAGYKIRDMSDNPPGIQLSGTGTSQMGAHVAGNGGSATITNTCVDAADVDYTVNVKAADGSNIACHPKIVNN